MRRLAKYAFYALVAITTTVVVFRVFLLPSDKDRALEAAQAASQERALILEDLPEPERIFDDGPAFDTCGVGFNWRPCHDVEESLGTYLASFDLDFEELVFARLGELEYQSICQSSTGNRQYFQQDAGGHVVLVTRDLALSLNVTVLTTKVGARPFGSLDYPERTLEQMAECAM